MQVTAPNTALLRGRSSASAPTAAEFYAPVDHLTGTALAGGVRSLLDRAEQSPANQNPGHSYDKARDFMFAKLDRAADGTGMVDLYSGATLHGVSSRGSANGAGVNTEHIWPQSQGATGPVKADLQHLGATLQPINEYRWHLPYGDVVDAQDGAAPFQLPQGAGSVGFDAAGRLVYEPRDAIKGVIARRLMYVQAHYGAQAPLPQDWNNRGFTDSLPTLLAWHAAHLPDAAELRRNDLVAGFEGIRNPVVDHPEWAADLMAGLATTPAPRPRDEQLTEWVEFLKDPSGEHGGAGVERAA
ncbi:MAG: hypothetical protein JWN72_492 [Thermoleophilia bacterium]|nr:hypothetical protein [Thermoleophilia bacterium]